VHLVIETLLNQTVKAKNIILWLCEEEFPGREKNLPEKLLSQRKKGLIIDWYRNNIRSYLKLIPALQKYSDHIIVTVDDDVYYSADLLGNLYSAYLKFPENIHTSACSPVCTFDKSGNITPYKDWLDCGAYRRRLKQLPLSYNYIPYGVSGVLYPPGVFYKDVCSEYLFTKLAPGADDLWFWAMAVLNGTKMNIVLSNHFPEYIENIQENTPCLLYDNLYSGGNDRQLKNILEYYPQIVKKLDKSIHPRKVAFLQRLAKKICKYIVGYESEEIKLEFEKIKIEQRKLWQNINKLWRYTNKMDERITRLERESRGF
jgi:hypothetical protein